MSDAAKNAPDLATVDLIRNDKLIEWSAKGAAGDVLQRVPHTAPICCIWINEKGEVKWSKANTNFESLSKFAIVLNEFAQSCIRGEL